MYWDDRWDLATEGRVYPKDKPKTETLVLVNPAEPFASPLVVERAVVTPEVEAWRRYVESRKAAHKPGDSPLRKPEGYKNINSANGSGPSGN